MPGKDGTGPGGSSSKQQNPGGVPGPRRDQTHASERTKIKPKLSEGRCLPCLYPSRRKIVQVVRAIGIEIGDLAPGLALIEGLAREVGADEERCAKLVAVIRGLLDEKDGEQQNGG